jgi:transcriptional regulator of arginine metabolism
MSDKVERQKAILDLVGTRAVSTQQELKELLKAKGFDVDQGTVSRDIKELGIVKVSDDGAHYKYAPVEAVAPPAAHKPAAIVARLVKKVDWSGNLLVVKTDLGEASPVSLAIDRLGWPEVAGTVAGDDTLLVVIREGVSARKVAKKILDLKRSKKDTA